jgi:peptidoglycan/xylan/chitin deacetylase (PgdA/CDA1 family)
MPWCCHEPAAAVSGAVAMDLLMIHDVRREYFDLPLDRYRLTFDDGLYSQYYYYPLLRGLPEPLTFFITTALIREAPARPQFTGRFLEHMKTGAYSYRAYIEKDLEGFMTLEEVRFLAEQANVRLGAHSHFHDLILTDVHPRKPKPVSPWKSARFKDVPEPLRRGLSIRSRLAFRGFEFHQGRLAPRSESDWMDDIRRDTELCLGWFEKHLGRAPKAYCFPFNEYSPPLIEILRSSGFEEFFASRSPKDPRIIGRTDIDSLPPGPASQT